MSRLSITKTPKVYVGGSFIRSESARTFPIKDAAGDFFASIPRCSRKDLRNAIGAAAIADSVKRVKLAKAEEPVNWFSDQAQSLYDVRDHLEFKTTWHPIGA